MPNAHEINAANRKAVAAKNAKLKAERLAAERAGTLPEADAKLAAKQAAQAADKAATEAAEQAAADKAAQTMPATVDSPEAATDAPTDCITPHTEAAKPSNGILADTDPAAPEADKPKRNEFQKTRDSVRENGALPHYAGLSQSVRRSGFKARNFSDYATSARSGNGHSPNSITERDLSAISAAIAYLADRAERESRELDLSEPFNPGAFGGDLSAFGIRGCGHGHFEILSDGSAMRITERGLQAAPRKPKTE